MDFLTVHIPLNGRKLVIAGAGEAADAMAGRFAGADIVRLSNARAFDPAAYAGAALALVVGDDDVFAQAAVRAARAAGIQVCADGRPALSDVILADDAPPAPADQAAEPGPEAAEPPQGFKDRLGDFLNQKHGEEPPAGSGRVAALLRRVQERVQGVGAGLGDRRELLHEIMRGPAAEAAAQGDMETAERLAREAMERRRASQTS